MDDQAVQQVIKTMVAHGRDRAEIEAFVRRAAAEDKIEAGRARQAGLVAKREEAEAEGGAWNTVKGGVSQWAGDWKDRLVAMARGGAKLGTMVTDIPQAYRDLRDVPEARRELGRGLSDSLLGVPAWLGDKAGITGYAQTAEHDASVSDDPRVKDIRGAGAIAGTAAMLPASGPLTKGLVTRIPGTASAATKAIAVAPYAAAGAGAVHGALDSREQVLPSRNPSDGTINPGSALAAFSDPTPMAVAGAVGSARGVSNLLRRNPTIGRYARAKQSGALDQPEMKALPKGQEGMQAASEQGLQRIVDRDRQLQQQAAERYQAATEPHLGTPVDTEALRMRLLEGRQGNIDPDSGLPIRPEVDQAYNTAFDKTPEAATVRGTLMRRRGLQQDAAFGAPSPTEGQLAQRDVYQTFRQAVREASPDVAAADDAYTAHARQAARRSDILFNTEENVIPSGGGGGFADARPVDADPLSPTGAAAGLDADPALRVGKARSAATTLSRIDDTNVPGLRAARFLQELADQDPAFASALEFIANKKAQEGTRFGLPQLPTNLTGATSFGGKLPFTQQNLRAAGARVVDPAADLIGRKIGPGALAVNPIVQAYAIDQERKRQESAQMARNLKAGGRR